jgi:type II secretory pathway pseudopilin PulG
MTAPRQHRLTRSGAAAIWVLVVLAVVAAVSVAATGRFVLARREADAYRNCLQAEWLARSGYELAVGKLIATPDGYTGETATPIPNGEVKIVVGKETAAKEVYRVECTARYPAGDRAAVVRTVTRTVKRTDAAGRASIAPAKTPRR